jgi:aryl-alcohol dehydrogenase-like predicted oxidoreductase
LIERLVRSSCDHPDHQTGASSLSGWTRDNHQSRWSAGRRQIVGCAISRRELTDAIYDNLRNLGLDALDIVNYRVIGSGHGHEEGSIGKQVTVLADLRRKGLSARSA